MIDKVLSAILSVVFECLLKIKSAKIAEDKIPRLGILCLGSKGIVVINAFFIF